MMNDWSKNPDDLARQREETLRRATQPGGSSGPMPWEQPRDLEEMADGMGRMAHEERIELARQAQQEGRNWLSRADQGLVALGEDGLPLSTINRAVDINTAQEYKPSSKEAIAIINKYFASQDCSEIHLNSPDGIFAKFQGERVKLDASFDGEEDYNRFIEDLVGQADTNYSWEEIKRQGRGVVRLAGGDRMMIFCPPISATVRVAVHKVVARQWNLQHLVDNGTMTPNMAHFLTSAVAGRANMLICGEMGSGKSSLLSLLAQFIGDNERVALIEEVPEIFVDLPDLTPLTYYPLQGDSVPMGLPEVLDTALYGRYDRIIIGEIHDRGMYRMLRVMGTGGDGSMSTFHAGDARGALDQVRNHVLLEYPQLPANTVAHFIRSAINLVVVMERIDGKHRVKEIAEVEWRNLSEKNVGIGTNILFEWDRHGRKTPDGKPGFISINRPDEEGKLVEKAARYGVHFQREWFPADNLMSR